MGDRRHAPGKGRRRVASLRVGVAARFLGRGGGPIFSFCELPHPQTELPLAYSQGRRGCRWPAQWEVLASTRNYGSAIMKISLIKYLAILGVVLLTAVAVGGWAKARMFATNAVAVEEDPLPSGLKLRGGAYYQEPLLY